MDSDMALLEHPIVEELRGRSVHATVVMSNVDRPGPQIDVYVLHYKVIETRIDEAEVVCIQAILIMTPIPKF